MNVLVRLPPTACLSGPDPHSMSEIYSLRHYSRLQSSGRSDSGLSRLGSTEERRETARQWYELLRNIEIDPQFRLDTTEDLLRIPERCRERLLDQAFVLDLRTLCYETEQLVQKEATLWDDMGDLDVWFLERIDRVINELLHIDTDHHRKRLPLEDPPQVRYEVMVEGMGVPVSVGRRACIVFNRLPLLARHSFIHILMLDEPVEEYCPRMQEEEQEVQSAIGLALRELSIVRRQWEGNQK